MTTIYSTGHLGWRALRREVAANRRERFEAAAVLALCGVVGILAAVGVL